MTATVLSGPSTGLSLSCSMSMTQADSALSGTWTCTDNIGRAGSGPFSGTIDRANLTVHLVMTMFGLTFTVDATISGDGNTQTGTFVTNLGDSGTYSAVRVINRPPDTPSVLRQLRSDGVTEIPVGSTTEESTVVFKARLTDADGDRVKLEIELRRLDERFDDRYFTGEPTEPPSDWVSSGGEATVTKYGLIPAEYHWRARAVDERGQVSDWVSFGVFEWEPDFLVVKILPVPYYSQGDTQWCVPASMSMIFGYYGQDIALWDIADDWNWDRQVTGWWELLQPGSYMVQKYFNEHGLGTEDIGLDFGTITAHIDQGEPVLLSMAGVLGIKHAVVVVGYTVIGGSQKVYVNDPSGALFESLGLSYEYPFVAVQVDWYSVAKSIGWGPYAYAIAVSGTPSPPKGTIDIPDFTPLQGMTDMWDFPVRFRDEENPEFGQVYGWLYGLDKGLIWMNSPRHPPVLNSRDEFRFDRYIVNHTGEQQTYELEIQFEVEYAEHQYFSASYFFTIPVGGRDARDQIMEDPIPLRKLLKYRGEYTLTLTLWNEAMTKIYDEVVFPPIKYAPLIEFYLASPVDLYITDPQGLHVGTEPSTGQAVNQIPGAIYTGPESEPEVIAIPEPADGSYAVLLIGRDTGLYSLTIELLTLEQAVTRTYTGQTVEGSIYAYKGTIGDESKALTTEPDPISELEHFKDFIVALPDDAFNQSIQRASHLKKALSNKIDEIISKVEIGDYAGAIKKLFNDIRAKMDGNATAEDWITDSQTQLNVCVIIDHIISDLESMSK